MSDHSSGLGYVILGVIAGCVLGGVLGGVAVYLSGLGCG